jgi:hypothetical protein
MKAIKYFLIFVTGAGIGIGLLYPEAIGDRTFMVSIAGYILLVLTEEK